MKGHMKKYNHTEFLQLMYDPLPCGLVSMSNNTWLFEMWRGSEIMIPNQ